ncbi:hypothetical protein ONO86_03236 [Micromonospora noduli]|uniref:Uncharacterized protein n=2 Tax=Micromonospora noduli TaxID=709876 RepID=A0A328N9R2_9ACTN|nr:hypothetical protein LAH08_03077 [Micromonospora noduli]RAO46700.1 hypothetical protein ONO86_03236 [Micromonospora noduli]
MVQYYRNCSPVVVSVTPYYKPSWGGITVFTNECQIADPGETILWNHSSTVPDANYSTAVCASGPGSVGKYQVSSITPCYTAFIPAAPRGGSMTQYYTYCGNAFEVVTSAWTDNGSLYVGTWACQHLFSGGDSFKEEARFNYWSTIPTAKYTTVRCDAKSL